MSQAIFSLPYFGSSSFFAELLKFDAIIIESEENFQKQTYRNRQYIYGANGKMMLNIPIKHSKTSTRHKYKSSIIDNSFPWQSLHFKSLETAYRTSPYFEFYESDIQPLYNNTYDNLFEFNLDCFKISLDLLELDLSISHNSIYKKEYDSIEDKRFLINAKKELKVDYPPYHQVFEEKFSFIENLSILDVLFSLGPESHAYLKTINVHQP